MSDEFDDNTDQVHRCLANIERYTETKPGFRRAHARGHGFRGYFTASAQAATLTTAEHMQGDRIETVLRFSNGSVNPYGPDRRNADRGPAAGLAIRFELPSGTRAEWVSLSLDRFVPRVPEDFIGFVAAARPGFLPGGLPDPLRLGAFLATHPQCTRGLLAILGSPASDSFATNTYHGLHTYYAVDAQGKRRPFRYRWLALQERRGLTKEDDKILPPQYLISELKRRLERAPVAWRLVFDMAEPGDPLDDMTELWPDDRPTIEMGELVVDRVHEDQEAVDASVFDPVNVPPGIETSDDPVLHFRSAIYAESKIRRAAEGPPAIKLE